MFAHRIHRLQHGLHIDINAMIGAESGPGADHGLLLNGGQGSLAEAASHPQRVVLAVADGLDL